MRSPFSRRALGVGALTITLCAAPLIPTTAASAADPAATAALGRTTTPDGSDLLATAHAADTALTPSARTEISRVVGEGRNMARARGGQFRPADLARCATFEGQRYCLGTGWTESTEAELAARFTNSMRTRTTNRESTGDLDAAALLQRRAQMSPGQREQADRRELTEAARSVGKVMLLRHQVLGEPLSRNFLARHPEITTKDGRPATRVLGRTDPTIKAQSTQRASARYPERSTVMNESRVNEQNRSYWCGPATMQMIAWGWNKTPESQAKWASRLGTTTSGSAITELVRVTNAYTGWDNPRRAGRYVTLDIGSFTYAQWYMLVKRHIYDYRAPLIFHPVLLKRYYSYLDDDASGHFQAGRGFDKNGSKGNLVGYFEPWNQQRFDRSEPYIARVQWRSAYRSFRANKAHFQHNIGV